jgi:hypothetical protein
LHAPTSDTRTSELGARRGRIVAIDDGEQVFVSVDGGKATVGAQLAMVIDRAGLRSAMDSGQEVILVFEHGDPTRPIIVGLVDSARNRSVRALSVEADVDGRRVRVVAGDELVLECGKASITLRRNGKVIVRGTEVETRADGTNRVRGGQVKIN